MAENVEKLTTGTLEHALRRYFADAGRDRYVLAFEVAESTGGGGRRVDAMALDCWPSGGWRLHGFELKVSRADWQRELADAAKSEAVSRYCDTWSLVTTAKVIRPGELPTGWGLYVYDDGRLRCTLKPAFRRDRLEPSRGLWASFARRATVRSENAEQLAQVRLEAAAEAKRSLEWQFRHDRGVNALRELEELREAMGGFGPREVREAVQLLRTKGDAQLSQWLLSNVASEATRLRRVLAQLEAAEQKLAEAAA